MQQWKDKMAKVYIERSYIEAHDQNTNTHIIEIAIKQDSQEILFAEVECPPKPWIYLDWNEDGDLILNNSEGMESNKWDHITKELLGEIDG